MKKYKYSLIIGSILVLIGIVLELLWKGVDDLTTTLFIGVGGGLMITSGLKIATKREEVEKDERVRKISVYSAFYSWMITAVFIIALLLSSHFRVVDGDAVQVLAWVTSVMTLSLVVCNLYLGRKGDVE